MHESVTKHNQHARQIPPCTTADDSLLSFALPSLRAKKITATFDGGNLSSDGGVLLLARIDKQIGLTDSLARALGSPHGGNHALPVRFASARKAAAIHTCTSKVEVGSRETAGRHTQQRDRIVPI